MPSCKRIAARDAVGETQRIFRHWHEAVRALQLRLAPHGVPFGHWTFLRILWDTDGLTQRELSAEAGVMEPTTHVALNVMERLSYIRRRRVAGTGAAFTST